MGFGSCLLFSCLIFCSLATVMFCHVIPLSVYYVLIGSLVHVSCSHWLS